MWDPNRDYYGFAVATHFNMVLKLVARNDVTSDPPAHQIIIHTRIHSPFDTTVFFFSFFFFIVMNNKQASCWGIVACLLACWFIAFCLHQLMAINFRARERKKEAELKVARTSLHIKTIFLQIRRVGWLGKGILLTFAYYKFWKLFWACKRCNSSEP